MLSKYALFSMLYCEEYSFSVSNDVPILYSDNFGVQLVFCKALLTNDFYN